MNNTIEAANQIAANIKATTALVNDMQNLVDKLDLDGTEDLGALRENIERMKETIAKNKATEDYIRNTAEDG